MHCCCRLLLALTFGLALSGQLQAASESEIRCGMLENAYGPFDYRVAPQASKKMVEDFHFTPDVQTLRRGSTSATPGGDLDYTLRAFPNHPRALQAMMELGFKTKSERPQGARWTVSCYFDRALRFAPNDGQVLLIYAIYLQRNSDAEGARTALVRIGDPGTSATLHYNMGLVYFRIGDYDRARYHAHAAYRLGYQLEGLRDLLQKAGKWSDTDPAGESNRPSEK